MTSAIYNILSKQISAVDEINVISNNMSHVEEGFKRDLTIFGLMNTPSTTQSSAEASVTQNPYAAKTIPDWSVGPMKTTSRNLDLALQNSQDMYGFFMISTQNGVRYTRSGRMHIQNGILVDNKSNPVLSRDMEEINIEAYEDDIRVEADGSIIAANAPIGQIGIASFDLDQLNQINKSHDGYMLTDIIPQFTEQVSVMQKTLEESNVNNIIELARFMEVKNAISMTQEINQAIDNTYREAYKNMSHN